MDAAVNEKMILVGRSMGDAQAVRGEEHGRHVNHGFRGVAQNGGRAGQQVGADLDHEEDQADPQRQVHRQL